MLQEPFPDDPPDDGKPEGSGPAGNSAAPWPDDDLQGPGQGLFVCLPAEELSLAGFAQNGQADTMAPGPLLATVLHTVIGEDGSLGDYLRSIEQMREMAETAGLRLLLPGHGPMLTDPVGILDYYLAHRAERLEQVRSALAAGAKTPAEIVAIVYADVDQVLWPAAETSVRAQLDYLAGQ